MPKTPEEMYVAIAKNLPEKTGKDLDEWKGIAKDAPEGRKTEKIEWLMGYGLGRGQAQTVLYYSEVMDIDYADKEGLVRDMLSISRNVKNRPPPTPRHGGTIGHQVRQG